MSENKPTITKCPLPYNRENGLGKLKAGEAERASSGNSKTQQRKKARGK